MKENQEYLYVDDIQQFKSSLIKRFNIDKEFRSDILNSLKQLKTKGKIVYEDNYKNEGSVRVFSECNLEIWKYICDKSKKQPEGTEKSHITVTDLLKYLKYADTDANRSNIIADINDICSNNNLIITNTEVLNGMWVQQVQTDGVENFTIIMPCREE